MPFDFACPDWEQRLRDGRTPIPDLPLDEKQAELGVSIFDRLRLPDVPGQPELRDAAGEWIRDVVRAIFGSMETSANAPAVRRVGEVFILVPKKNAKTTSAAAIAITFMLMNRRHHADMLIIGPTQKISEVAFEQAKGMIETDEFLKKRFHVQDHRKQIVDRTNKSRLMIRTFGMDVLTGSKPIFCLIDEIHILGAIPYAADVMRQIRGGMLPFPEALLVMITTQSDHPPAGVFKSELQYARGVRDGRITENVRTLPVLYEFPEAMQKHPGQPWRNPEVWHMVTPNLGRSISIDALRNLMARAEEDGPDELIAWATQHLNVEVGMALHRDRWIGADYWEGNGEDGLTLERLLATSDVAVIGGDAGGADDLFSLAVLGRHRQKRVWQVWVRAWCLEIVLERRKEIAARLRDFARVGDLVITENAEDHILGAVEVCEQVREAGLLPEENALGFDPFGIAALVDALADAGFDEKQITGVGQGFKLNGAIRGLERRLYDGNLSHGNQPLLTWAVSNAKAEQRGNNVMITKQAAGTAKIDPLIAVINAAVLMDRNPVVQPSSYLEAGSLLVL
jgi:phage terminase large subunit-like protein